MSLDLEGIDDFWCREEDREEQGACLDEDDPSLTAEERSPSLMERR